MIDPKVFEFSVRVRLLWLIPPFLPLPLAVIAIVGLLRGEATGNAAILLVATVLAGGLFAAPLFGLAYRVRTNADGFHVTSFLGLSRSTSWNSVKRITEVIDTDDRRRRKLVLVVEDGLPRRISVIDRMPGFDSFADILRSQLKNVPWIQRRTIGDRLAQR